MTKFENIGVQHQYSSVTKQEANRQFAWSCNCCCQKGMKIDCDRCAIAYAHESIIAIIDDQDAHKPKHTDASDSSAVKKDNSKKK